MSGNYTVYVLRSLKNGKRYVGFTAQDVHKRLRQHNAGSGEWTARNGPFELIYREAFQNCKAAQQRERFLKSGHGRAFLDKLIPR